MKVRRVSSVFVCAALFAALSANPGSAAVSTLPASALAVTGYQALAAGDASRALPLFSQAIESGELEPDVMANALFNRGLAYQQLGQAANAVNDYTSALNLDAMTSALRAKVLYNRGVAHQDLKQSAAAIEDFTGALLIDSGFSYAYLARANTLRDSGQYLFAISDYERALKYHHPDAGRVYLDEAVTFEDLKRPVDAKRLYQLALSANPSLTLASERLQVLGNAADSDETVVDPILTSSISTSPQSSTAVISSNLPKGMDPPAALGGESVQAAADDAQDEPAPAPQAAAAPAAQPAGDKKVLLSSVPSIPKPANAAKDPEVVTNAITPAPAAPKAAVADPVPQSGWAVQISSANSEALAWATWNTMLKSHKNLASEKPVVVKADLAGKGTVYRLRLPAFDSQQAAQSSCARLKAAGVACFVARAEG